MSEMKTFLIILSIIIIIGFVFIIIQDDSEIYEIEIIVTHKYRYSAKKTAISTVGGYSYAFYNEYTESFHPGGIYWIKYSQGKVLEFRKLGDLNVISLGES